MIQKLSIFEKYLNYLLLLLFPTQLALHFWPGYSFIYGIRVDYLSPAIYFTDLLFVTLFVLWFFKNRRIIFIDIIKYQRVLAILFVIVLLNLFNSVLFQVSLFKWVKIIEYVVLGYYVSKRKDVFSGNTASTILFTGLVLFSLIGVFQIVRGETIGGFLYYLGERKFSIYTPGISLFNLFGRNFLRTYSTFSHPNSFAGYTCALAIYLMFNKPKIHKMLLFVGTTIILAALLLSFSFGAFIAALICLLFYVCFIKTKANNKIITTFFLCVLLVSVLLMLLSNLLTNIKTQWPENIAQRLELSLVSGNIVKDNLLSGSGLNTFPVKEINYSDNQSTTWLLQPVHNIFLLVLAETGIVGLLFLCLIISKYFKNMSVLKSPSALLVIVFVLTSGLFDHYWFTLQQNLILLAFLVGTSLQKK